MPIEKHIYRNDGSTKNLLSVFLIPSKKKNH